MPTKPGSANDLVDAFRENFSHKQNFLHHYYSPNQTIEDGEDYNVLYIGASFGKIFANRWRICHYLPGLQIILEMSGVHQERGCIVGR